MPQDTGPGYILSNLIRYLLFPDSVAPGGGALGGALGQPAAGNTDPMEFYQQPATPPVSPGGQPTNLNDPVSFQAWREAELERQRIRDRERILSQQTPGYVAEEPVNPMIRFAEQMGLPRPGSTDPVRGRPGVMTRSMPSVQESVSAARESAPPLPGNIAPLPMTEPPRPPAALDLGNMPQRLQQQSEALPEQFPGLMNFRRPQTQNPLARILGNLSGRIQPEQPAAAALQTMLPLAQPSLEPPTNPGASLGDLLAFRDRPGPYAPQRPRGLSSPGIITDPIRRAQLGLPPLEETSFNY